VAGRGIGLLREAGIEVEVGVLEEEARILNERFVHNMVSRTPFVISKVAMTLDGKIAAYNGHSKWITGEESRHNVHLLRNEVDAILVGIGTVLADDPMLTTRLATGGKSPIRVVLDSDLKTPLEAKIMDTTEAKTLIVAKEGADQAKAKVLEEKGIEIIYVPKTNIGLDLAELLNKLYEKGVTDLLVEGGSEINGSFLRAGLINKYFIYVAPKILGGRDSLAPFTGDNVESMDEALNVTIHSVENFGEDILITAYPK
jgi:diaminohydroxyphosphoribosylaminopyrimidine deaminase/5-amino-6-(5-phosphoribosylamino)uracil reductase